MRDNASLNKLPKVFNQHLNFRFVNNGLIKKNVLLIKVHCCFYTFSLPILNLNKLNEIKTSFLQHQEITPKHMVLFLLDLLYLAITSITICSSICLYPPPNFITMIFISILEINKFDTPFFETVKKLFFE